MPDFPKWSGIIVDKDETAKSFKWIGKTEQGHTNTFWQGKDQKPLPMNEHITITYKESEYPHPTTGEMVKSKWVNGFTALQKPQAQQRNGSAGKDTFPSVREQFIKEVVSGWCRNGLVLPEMESLKNATIIANKVWAMVVEAPGDPSEPANMDVPPPSSPDDYGQEIPF